MQVNSPFVQWNAGHLSQDCLCNLNLLQNTYLPGVVMRHPCQCHCIVLAPAATRATKTSSSRLLHDAQVCFLYNADPRNPHCRRCTFQCKFEARSLDCRLGLYSLLNFKVLVRTQRNLISTAFTHASLRRTRASARTHTHTPYGLFMARPDRVAWM